MPDGVFNQEFFKFLASLGTGGIIAGLMFYWYRKDVRAYHDLWQGQSTQLLHVVQDNTRAITELVLMVKAMHHRLDMKDG